MNLYSLIGSGIGTAEAASLSQRLVAWHDAMVAHERRLRGAHTDGECDQDCAHSEARLLWAEALTIFGDRAQELTFLRSRATSPRSQIEDGAVPVTGEQPAGGKPRSSRSARRRGISGRHQAAFVSASGGRTIDEKEGAEL
jgi:hypothetical protein